MIHVLKLCMGGAKMQKPKLGAYTPEELKSIINELNIGILDISKQPDTPCHKTIYNFLNYGHQMSGSNINKIVIAIKNIQGL